MEPRTSQPFVLRFHYISWSLKISSVLPFLQQYLHWRKRSVLTSIWLRKDNVPPLSERFPSETYWWVRSKYVWLFPNRVFHTWLFWPAKEVLPLAMDLKWLNFEEFQTFVLKDDIFVNWKTWFSTLMKRWIEIMRTQKSQRKNAQLLIFSSGA